MLHPEIAPGCNFAPLGYKLWADKLNGIAPGVFKDTTNIDPSVFRSEYFRKSGRETFTHCVTTIYDAIAMSCFHPQPSVLLRETTLKTKRSAEILYRTWVARIKEHYRLLKNRGMMCPSQSGNVGDVSNGWYRDGNFFYGNGFRHRLNTARRSSILALKIRLDFVTEHIDHIVTRLGRIVTLEDLKVVTVRLAYLCFIFNNLL
jgi:hypothetical protein